MSVCARKLSLCHQQYVCLHCNDSVMVNQLAFTLTHSSIQREKGKSLFCASWYNITAQMPALHGQEWNSAICFEINKICLCSPISLRTREITGNTFSSRFREVLEVCLSAAALQSLKICSHQWTGNSG